MTQKMGYCIIKIAYFQKPLKQIIKIWFVPPTDLWISTNRGRFLIPALSGAAQQFTALYKKSLRVWCVPCRSTRWLSLIRQPSISFLHIPDTAYCTRQAYLSTRASLGISTLSRTIRCNACHFYLPVLDRQYTRLGSQNVWSCLATQPFWAL